MSVLRMMPTPVDEPEPRAGLTPQITLTYTLLDMAGVELGSVNAPAYLRIALCGFGPTLPCVPGTCMVGKVATWPGDIPYIGAPGTYRLWGNDVITPPNTYYSIAVLDPNKNCIQSGIYQFAGIQTVDLSSAQQVPIQPAPSALGPMTEYVFVATGPGLTVTLPSTPYSGTLVLVWRGGIKLSVAAGDYTISGPVITFTRGYLAGDVIDVLYQPTLIVSTLSRTTEYVYVATGPGLTVTLPFMPYPGMKVAVLRSGMKLSVAAGDYTINGQVITFSQAYVAGDVIDVLYTIGNLS